MDERKRKAEKSDAEQPGADVRREEAAHEAAEGEARPGAAAEREEAAEPAEAEAEAVEPEIVEPEPEKSEADELREQLAELQGRLRTVSKAYTDLQREMRAFRARMDDQLKFNKERQAFETVKAFFDPVMNLKRSMAAHGDDMGLFIEGLQIIEHQFDKALEQLGLRKVPGEGADFDPNLHEALAVTPVTDPAQDGKILMVHADGYSVDGRVLQAAQVVIGKYEAPQGEA